MGIFDRAKDPASGQPSPVDLGQTDPEPAEPRQADPREVAPRQADPGQGPVDDPDDVPTGRGSTSQHRDIR